MQLKLQLDQSLITGTTISKTISVDSENMNLIKCIESVTGDDCRISFRKYYGNTDLMNFENMFPYIIADGEVQWYVPFSDVTIKDFRITHNLDSDETIFAEIDDYGGGGDEVSELISWIASNWDVINSGLGTASSVITIGGFIRKIYKYFADKRKRLPYFGDVQEVIERQSSWDSSVLMKLLKVDDSELMSNLASSIGYKRIDNIFFKESADDGKIFNIDDNSASIWGVQTCSRWTESITREIHSLNLLLTDLKYRSENLDLHLFQEVETEVNNLIDEWDTDLAHGDNLCFVKLINPPRSYERNAIVRDINTITDKAQDLLYSIAELEESATGHALSDLDVISYDSDKDIEPDGCEEREKTDSSEPQESEEIEEPNDEEYQELEENDGPDYTADEDEIDYYVSPWEILLTRLLLNSHLAEIVTNHGTITAYVEQIYDNDVLLQVLSKDGTLIEYQTCNYYDIQLVTTDTKDLNALEEATPKSTLPTFSSIGISAKKHIFNYAEENALTVKAFLGEMVTSPITGIVSEVEESIGELDDQLIKVQIFNEKDEVCGNAWIEMTSVEWVSLPVI